MGESDVQRIGRYLLRERIAAGGMAEIYLADMVGAHDFHKTVVVKKILPHLAADPHFVTMFIDEAKTTAKLNHPKIVQVHELGQEGDELFIAMEFVEGTNLLKTLQHYYRVGSEIPSHSSVHIAAEVLDALHYAHSAQSEEGEDLRIVHRDVTPANILLSARGAVKLADFGIARAADNKTRTVAGTLKGKCGYMSPEQIEGSALDGRSDIYACSITLAESLMGRRLFKGPTEYDTLVMVQEGCLDRLFESRSSMDDDLFNIVVRGLDKDRTKRFQTAGAMRDALHYWLSANGPAPSGSGISSIVANVLSSPVPVDADSDLTPVLTQTTADKLAKEAIDLKFCAAVEAGLALSTEDVSNSAAQVSIGINFEPPTSERDENLSLALDKVADVEAARNALVPPIIGPEPAPASKAPEPRRAPRAMSDNSSAGRHVLPAAALLLLCVGAGVGWKMYANRSQASEVESIPLHYIQVRRVQPILVAPDTIPVLLKKDRSIAAKLGFDVYASVLEKYRNAVAVSNESLSKGANFFLRLPAPPDVSNLPSAIPVIEELPLPAIKLLSSGDRLAFTELAETARTYLDSLTEFRELTARVRTYHAPKKDVRDQKKQANEMLEQAQVLFALSKRQYLKTAANIAAHDLFAEELELERVRKQEAKSLHWHLRRVLLVLKKRALGRETPELKLVKTELTEKLDSEPAGADGLAQSSFFAKNLPETFGSERETVELYNEFAKAFNQLEIRAQ